MSETKNGYLKIKTFFTIVGIVVIVLLTVFSATFAGIKGNREKCDAHINSHIDIAEQLGRIEATLTQFISRMDKTDNKIDKIFEKINN
jgi:hypothetical protein